MNQDLVPPVVDTLTPVGFRVLLTIYKKPNETRAGFELPEMENSGMPLLGKVTILGKKTIWQHVQILLGLKPVYKVGQWVYFRKYSVDELRFSTPEGDVTLFVLEEDEIIGQVN